MSKTYLFNEGRLDIPERWQDESLNVLTFPDKTGGNLVINRTPLPTGVTPEAYYEQVIAQFRTHLQDYFERQYQVITLSGEPAHWLDYQWRSPEGTMHQLSLLQIRGDSLLTFTYTHAAELTAQQKEMLLDVLLSFKPHAD